MQFATIGAWLDKKIDSAQSTWRGSEAKKAIQEVIQRSKEGIQETTDQVSLSTSEARENVQQNLGDIRKKHEDGSFGGYLKSFMEVGNQGGLIGLAMKKPKAVPPQLQQQVYSQPPPVTTNKQPENVEGWNIAK